MWETGCGALPVVDACGLVIGIITDRDISMALMKARLAPDAIDARHAMTPWVRSCAPDDDIRSVLETMKRFHVRRLPVVSHHRLAGMLTLDDLVLRAVAPDGVTPSEVIDMLKSVLCAKTEVARPQLAARP